MLNIEGPKERSFIYFIVVQQVKKCPNENKTVFKMKMIKPCDYKREEKFFRVHKKLLESVKNLCIWVAFFLKEDY